MACCCQLLGTKLTDEELKQREDALVLLESLIRDMEAMFYKEKTGQRDNNRLASKAKAELDAARAADSRSGTKGGGRSGASGFCVFVVSSACSVV